MSAAFDKYRMEEYRELLTKIADYLNKPSSAGSIRGPNGSIYPYDNCGDPACVSGAIESLLRSAGFLDKAVASESLLCRKCGAQAISPTWLDMRWCDNCGNGSPL